MNNKQHFYFDLVGWVGTSLILLAYILNIFEIIQVTDPLYLILNIIGSLGIVIITYIEKANQPLFLNLIWALVALISLLK